MLAEMGEQMCSRMAHMPPWADIGICLNLTSFFGADRVFLASKSIDPSIFFLIQFDKRTLYFLSLNQCQARHFSSCNNQYDVSGYAGE